MSEPLEPPTEEECSVEMWRRMRFEQLGFREYPAHRLAVSGADVYAAERLLAAGATHDQVRRILT